MMPWLMLAIPLAIALLCAFPGSQRIAAQALTIAGTLAMLTLAVLIALRTRDCAVVALPDHVAIDGFSALIALLVALIGSTAAVYSWGYMARATAREPRRLRVYYANFNLFLFSMIAIPAVVEPTLVWIFVEATTLSSALLVSFERTHAARRRRGSATCPCP